MIVLEFEIRKTFHLRRQVAHDESEYVGSTIDSHWVRVACEGDSVGRHMAQAAVIASHAHDEKFEIVAVKDLCTLDAIVANPTYRLRG